MGNGTIVSGGTRYDRVLRRLMASVFSLCGVGLFAHVTLAVVTTQRLCSAYPLCRVVSYEWYPSGAGTCPCIVFIDRVTQVSTYAEWSDPVDTTANLAALAVAGELRIVQIINRQLPVLPDELRSCRGLEQLTLIYTKTLQIPDWANTFTGLEYLHIEGDFTPKRLARLPQTLFINMPRLAFLHLGCLVELPELPPFGYLPRLQYLVLAMLHSITEIPSLDQLTNLRQLSIIDAIRVTKLPSTAHQTKLTTFVLSARNPVCCNGFIDGVCDLTAKSCRDRTASGEPRVECTSNRMSAEDGAKLYGTDGAVCSVKSSFDLADLVATYPSTDVACGGVMYRQCVLFGISGICFPGRLQPISCQIDPSFAQMRRLQIQRNVGDPCDSVPEKWLGCGEGHNKGIKR